MIKNFEQYLKEWIDSPGSVDVPGQSFDVKVNSRNYAPANPPLPEIVDAMYEATYFHDFLDKEGKSEEFNKFLSEDKRTGSQITNYIKDSFKEKATKKK
jgi:hypothetical protein